jgi:dTDP-glucose 4,6-dehydratase
MSSQSSQQLCLLVTGGAGFIGSNLVRRIIQHTEHRVINLDALTYAGHLSSLEDVADNPRHQFFHQDLVDYEPLVRLLEREKPDAIIHLAAESHVDRSIDGPGAFIQTNVIGTYNLLQATRTVWESYPADKRHQFRFLHVSTDEVFGSLESSAPAFTESSPYQPHSPYSASKAASDHLARAWADTYGLPVMVSNCSNNYGPSQHPEKLIPVVIHKCLTGDSIPVYGKGENIRDWLFVEDHCRALLRIVEAGRPGETYNIGGGNEWQNLHLVQTLCRLVDELRGHLPAGKQGSEELIKFVVDRPGHDYRYAINSAKIRAELGWEPLQSVQSGLRLTVQWYLDNLEWSQEILGSPLKVERQGLNKSTSIKA